MVNATWLPKALLDALVEKNAAVVTDLTAAYCANDLQAIISYNWQNANFQPLQPEEVEEIVAAARREHSPTCLTPTLTMLQMLADNNIIVIGPQVGAAAPVFPVAPIHLVGWQAAKGTGSAADLATSLSKVVGLLGKLWKCNVEDD